MLVEGNPNPVPVDAQCKENHGVNVIGNYLTVIGSRSTRCRIKSVIRMGGFS